MPTAGPLHPAPATITLLLADDRLVVREGLKRIVAECPDMSVVGEAATWDEVVEQTRATRPDVVLVDFFLGGARSEERRVGKECRCRWGTDRWRKRAGMAGTGTSPS